MSLSETDLKKEILRFPLITKFQKELRNVLNVKEAAGKLKSTKIQGQTSIWFA